MGVLGVLGHSLLVMLMVICFHVTPASLTFTSFVFGDSLVDCGNNDYIFTLSRADSPPYGIDFKPSGGRPTGRFTNGRTISDIIGEALGAKSFPPPYLAPNATIGGIQRGINYASGASGILDETGVIFIGRVPLREQVNYFEQTKSYMVKLKGETGTKRFLKKAMFSVTIGSNDILNYITPDIPFFARDKAAPGKFQDFMVSNLTIQLKRLHEMGARKFIVVGVGPLGCIPFVRALKLLPVGECCAEVNQLIKGYNSKLKVALHRLNRELGPQAIFTYANSYDIFWRIILGYRQYGFENAANPCCGGSFPPFVCFNRANADAVLCNNRSNYVFWDAYHPTEAANVIVAKELLDGDHSISFPMNIRQLYNY